MMRRHTHTSSSVCPKQLIRVLSLYPVAFLSLSLLMALFFSLQVVTSPRVEWTFQIAQHVYELIVLRCVLQRV
jgi:hypothetical protein